MTPWTPQLKLRHAAPPGRALHPLAIAGWALIAGGALAEPVIGKPGSSAFAALIVAFFAVQAVRVCAAAKRDTGRRGPLALLLAGLVLWAGASLLVTTRELGRLTHFPSPEELLFLAAYIALAGYLVFGSGVRVRSSLAAWLDVVVICGATACVASSVLLLPAEGKSGAVLLALVYPLLDVVLAMLVLAQLALRLRHGLRRALPIAAAFLLFASADVQLIGQLPTHHPGVPLVVWVARGVGFALLVGSACRPVELNPNAVAPRAVGAVVGAAAALATGVLVLRPPGALGIYVAIPAAITLLGACARLTAALQIAHRAVEALARSQVDDLTRLANRRALSARLEAGRAAAEKVALIVLDLDGFKDINDTLGHASGDEVLERVGDRIQHAVPSHALVARLGGDEFGILALGCTRVQMTAIAGQVQHALSQPLHVDGINLALSASVGIVDCAEDAALDSNELVRRAEVAMYRAKQARSGIAYYDSLHDDFSKARLRISDELRRGIAGGELEVWYQPQIDASTLRPCALEALVRWRHPTDGLLTPPAFLPAARRAGLMPLLSQEVVRRTVGDVARWHAAGLRLRVAINCAPPELLSGVFVPPLREAMSAAGVPPEHIVLEVTEESFIAEPDRARELLQDVREQGVQIAIDDYGTGFSSLAYLRDLPIDELKLDRTFVSPIGSDERSRMIVASTVQMARALGMRTVAEGVEDAATAADLIAIGVDALQGYHISRPLPAAEVVDWIVRWPTFADLRITASPPPARPVRAQAQEER